MDVTATFGGDIGPMVKAMAQLNAAMAAQKVSAEKQLTITPTLDPHAILAAQANIQIQLKKWAATPVKIPVQPPPAPPPPAPPNVFTGLGGAIGSGMLGLVGVGAVYQAIDGIKSLREEMAQTANAALKLNASTDSIQRIGLMAKMSGEDVSSVSSSLIKLERSLFGSAKDSAMEQAFHSLGIDARHFIGLAPEQQIITLAQALQKADKDGRGTVEMYELLSKKAEGMLPVLRQNVEELQKLGGMKVIDKDDIADAKEQADAWDLAWASAKRYLVQISAGGDHLRRDAQKSFDRMAANADDNDAPKGPSAKEKAFAEAELQEKAKRARRTVEVETERSKKQAPLAASMGLEMAISSATAQRNSGGDIRAKIIEQLQDQLKILALQKQYKEDFKLNDAHALQLATQRVALERSASDAGEKQQLDTSRQQLDVDLALNSIRERRAKGDYVDKSISDQLTDYKKLLDLRRQYKETFKSTDKEADQFARAKVASDRAADDAVDDRKLNLAREEYASQLAINVAKEAAVDAGQGEVNKLEDQNAVLRLQQQLRDQLDISDAEALTKAQAMVAAQRAIQNALNAQANADHGSSAAATHARAIGQTYQADKIEREQSITKTAREILKTNPNMDPKAARRQAESEQRDKDKLSGKPIITRAGGIPSGIGQGHGLDDFYAKNPQLKQGARPGFAAHQAGPNNAAAQVAHNAAKAAQKQAAPVDPAHATLQSILTEITGLRGQLKFAN
jgi:hypothetical protein